MTRRCVTTLCVALFVLGVFGVASATTFNIANYSIANLGGLNGRDVFDTGTYGPMINFRAYSLTEAGTVTGDSYLGGANPTTLPTVVLSNWTAAGGYQDRYHTGQAFPYGLWDGLPLAGNDAGTIAWTDGSGKGHLWTSAGGNTSPAGLSNGANWINASGQVAAGNAENGTPGSLYPAGTTLPGCALYINDAGIAAGTEGYGAGFVYNASGVNTYWPSGGTTISALEQVNAVSQNGKYAVGMTGGTTVAYLYTGNGTASPTVTKTLSGEAFAVNNIGWMGGDTETNNSGNFGGTAWIWDGTTQTNLNTAIQTQFPSLAGWTFVAVWGVNDSNQILVWGQPSSGINDSDQGIESFLLTPTPEPSTLLLLASGAIGLLAYAWRKRK